VSPVLNKNMSGLLLPVIIIFFLIPTEKSSAQKREGVMNRLSLSFGIGNWQPHSLNDEPKFDTFGAAGATPSIRVGITIPVGLASGLELTTRFWSLHDLDEPEQIHSLSLVPFTLNLKHWLVPDYLLSAYVIYGASLVRGFENQTDPLTLSTTAKGWGINLGAGLDLTISRSLGAGIAFTYHYVRFSKPIGGVDDFSGPNISARIYWLL